MLGSLNQAAQAAGGTPPVQVIADTRTNSVLLSGAGAARLQYRALVAHLDTPSAQGGDTLVTLSELCRRGGPRDEAPGAVRRPAAAVRRRAARRRRRARRGGTPAAADQRSGRTPARTRS